MTNAYIPATGPCMNMSPVHHFGGGLHRILPRVNGKQFATEILILNPVGHEYGGRWNIPRG